jgi:hypothetical protein
MPTEAKHKRIYWFNHLGVSVLMMDFSRATPQESLDLMDDFAVAMEGQAENSVRMLTDLTEASYEPSISGKWKAVRVKYDHQIKSSGVYGLSGLVGVAVRSFVDMAILMNLPRAGKKLRIFKTREQALAWLVKV